MATKRQTGQASPAPDGDPGAGAPVAVRVRLLEAIEKGGEVIAAGTILTVAAFIAVGYVAGNVLAALVAQGDYRSTPQLLAANAVSLADCLIEELARRK